MLCILSITSYFIHCTLASVISVDMSMPVIFSFDQRLLINLFAKAVIRSSLQRLKNDFTIISKGAFILFWTSLLWLLDCSVLLSCEISKRLSPAAEEILNIFFGPFISLEILTRIYERSTLANYLCLGSTSLNHATITCTLVIPLYPFLLMQYLQDIMSCHIPEISVTT